MTNRFRNIVVKNYKPVFILIGLVLILVALFAGRFGIDPNNGWGPRRVGILFLGVATYLFPLLLQEVRKVVLLINENRRRFTQIVFLVGGYAVIAIAFLSPLASNNDVQAILDFRVHINLITQAKLALDEGQFPIRVAPEMNWGYRYPYFQFYSPFPYTVAGLIYKWITPENAFLAYRFLIFLSLFIAAIYVFRLSFHFTRSIPASYLAGMIYMTAPYYLINIFIRSAWPEAIAQALLPMSLYYTIKTHSAKQPKYIIAAILSWFILCTTHIITFVYSIFFVGLLIFCISLPLTKQNLGKAVLTYLTIIAACLLAWYYLEPVIFTPISMKSWFWNPFDWNWLSPIFTLLSPVSIPSGVQPGDLASKLEGLPSSIGWIMLLSVGYILYIIFTKEMKWKETEYKNIPLILLGIFLISFFMAWSPVNFWKFLPTTFYVTQFPFRFLAHTMWSGAILCAYALVNLFYDRKMTDLTVLLGILIIGMSHASWLNMQNLPVIHNLPLISVASAMNVPVTIGGHYTYSIVQSQNIQMPDITVDQTKNFCTTKKMITVCEILTNAKQVAQLPSYYYPGMLSIQMDGQPTGYFPTLLKDTNEVLAGVEVLPGYNRIEIRFVGSKTANLVSLIAWIFLIMFVTSIVVITPDSLRQAHRIFDD